MKTILQDLRYGFRLLLKNPAFAATAVITLALGIGANSAIFSVVNTVVFRPLDFRDPDRIVHIWEKEPASGPESVPLSAPDFFDFRAQSQSFESLGGYISRNFNLTGVEEAERVAGARVTAGFFQTLAASPLTGRTFNPEDEQASASQSVVVSHGLWQRLLGGGSDALGRTLILDGKPYAIIGVMPPGFNYPLSKERTELWIPLTFSTMEMSSRGFRSTGVIARLKPDVSLETAQAEVETIAGRLEQEHSDSNSGIGATVVAIHDEVIGDVKPVLLALLGAVSFVLAVACANIANLLLARSTSREKEISIRVALGASRARITAQLLTESLLVSVLGGAVGLLVAKWGAGLLPLIATGDIPRIQEITIDYRVLAFTASVSILTGVLFGLIPALQASRPDLTEPLREGGRSQTLGARPALFRSLLVISEVAFSLVLLVGAGLMINSFVRLLNVDPGIRPQNVLTAQVTLTRSKYMTDQQMSGYFKELIERVEQVHGIESVGAISHLPLTHSMAETAFSIEGRPQAEGESMLTNFGVASPNYFRSMGIAFIDGRDFTEYDREGAPGVAIINESLARRFFADENPLGKLISISLGDPTAREIVGVVGDVKHSGPGKQSGPEVYLPYTQLALPRMNLVVRAQSNPTSYAAAIKSQARAVDKDQPIASITTMEEYLSQSLARPRLNAFLFAVFSILALALAATGIYGVMSFSMAQRTREIALRMALGATPGKVLKLVVGQWMLLCIAGIAIGLGASLALTRYLSTQLFGIAPTDPATMAAASLLLIAVAFVASYIPARWATKVDPMVALRHE